MNEVLASFDLSYSRYWGTPIPVWISEDGEEQVPFVGSWVAIFHISPIELASIAMHCRCVLAA